MEADFVKQHAQERLREERLFLDELVELPDPQCSWQLLVRCAVPRANYRMRTLPPELGQEYAEQRDETLWAAAMRILGAEGSAEALSPESQRIARLPARLGGSGLRSTVRSKEACYWASWADALEMIKARNPGTASMIVDRLEMDRCQGIDCLRCRSGPRHGGLRYQACLESPRGGPQAAACAQGTACRGQDAGMAILRSLHP